MKKIILVLIAALSLSACQKEFSYEKPCGIVQQKIIRDNGFFIDVSFDGQVKRINIGLLPFSKINAGDTYCP